MAYFYDLWNRFNLYIFFTKAYSTWICCMWFNKQWIIHFKCTFLLSFATCSQNFLYIGKAWIHDHCKLCEQIITPNIRGWILPRKQENIITSPFIYELCVIVDKFTSFSQALTGVSTLRHDWMLIFFISNLCTDLQ